MAQLGAFLRLMFASLLHSRSPRRSLFTCAGSLHPLRKLALVKIKKIPRRSAAFHRRHFSKSWAKMQAILPYIANRHIWRSGNAKKRRQLSVRGFHLEGCFRVFDYAVGRVAVNVVPSSSLFASMVPPCSSATSFAMESPRPKPPVPLVRALSAR